jgi:3-methyladenine DNA glycosylase AlkD
MNWANVILEELKNAGDPKKAKILQVFFKTGPGEYGFGDLFYGIAVPVQREISREFQAKVSWEDLSALLHHTHHEARLTALHMLVYRYQKSTADTDRDAIVRFYFDHLDRVNNWDLVDSSCYQILGHFYLKREKALFYGLADSGHLWRQRVAMISSFYWIKKGEFVDALALAEKLKNHPHDLMHKAVGWMLREIGKRDFDAEYEFLKKHYQTMPRTALRYAIEKFPEELRQDFLKGRV